MANSNVNITVTANVASATAGLQRVSQSMQDISRNSSLEKLSDKFTSVGEKMRSFGETASKWVSLPLLGAGIASVKLASDMTENINKTQVVFGKNAQAVQKWADTTLKSFGIANVSALDMASKFGDMGTSMGLTQTQMVGMSEKLVGLAGDMASFKNVTVQQASDALTGVFTGETESLKSLGIVMTDTQVKAYAMANGFKGNWEQADQATKVMYRYQFVTNACKNSMGDFSNTSGSTANQTRLFSNTLQQLGVSFGMYILPVITPVIAKLNDMLQAFGNLDPATKRVILVLSGIAIVVFPLITVIGNLCIAIGGIISVVSAVGIATIGFIAGFVAIGVAVGALAYLIVTHWSQIKTESIAVWNSIKTFFISTFNGIVAGASQWFAGVSAKFAQAGESGRQTVNAIRSVFAGVFSYIASPFQSAWSSVSGIISNIKSACSNIWSGFRSFHIPLPHFNISGSFSIVPPRMPSIGVSWFANGGVVDSPTAGVFGEAGKEALVPMYSSRAMTDVGYAVAKSMPDNVEGNGTGNITFEAGSIVINALTKEEDPTKLARRCTDAINKELYKVSQRERRGRGKG